MQVEDTADATVGGVILPESAKERPVCGTVVRTGPGKWQKDEEPQVKKVPVRCKESRLLYAVMYISVHWGTWCLGTGS